jgi:hypothetical protein
VSRVEPSVIADVLVRTMGAAAGAIDYELVGWFENLAIHVAGRRLRTTPTL